jgi:hypothetical protein
MARSRGSGRVRYRLQYQHTVRTHISTIITFGPSLTGLRGTQLMGSISYTLVSNVGGDGSEVNGDGGGGDDIDGDGSGGTSPSRQGAKIETSVTWNLSVAAAELQNSFSKNTDRFWIFRPEALYRRRGGVRGSTRPPHHGAVRARGARHPMVSLPSSPPPALFRSSSFVREK